MSIPKSFIPSKPFEIDKISTTTPSSFVPTKETSELDINKVSQLKASGGAGGFRGFFTGIAKGAGSTIFGAGKLGTAIGRTLLPKSLEPDETIYEKEKPEFLEPKGGAEKAGAFVEQVAEFAIPATKLAKVQKGASFLIKLVSRALTSGAVATVQAGEVGKETAIAAGIEATLPVAAKPAKWVFDITKRLFKGVGSGLSGVSTDVIDTIVKNPEKALEVSRQLEKSGNFSVLEKNAETIVKGVAKIKQEARKAYGEAIQKLKSIDINPKIFKNSVQEFLDKVGSSVKGAFRELKNVEFEKSANIKKASNLIDDLSTTKLDGFSLRKLLEKVSNSRFKTTGTDPERLSYNAFISDFEKSLKTAISNSTDKLGEINKAFSTDMQLAEGIERIFGKIKFKNLSEVDKVAQKLETLFSQKGLNPRDIDNFLNRIGVSPEDFRTSEGVRQITSKITGANTKGLTITELIQQATSAVITPDTVKNISIVTGLVEPTVKKLFENLSPTARGSLIKLLIE